MNLMAAHIRTLLLFLNFWLVGTDIREIGEYYMNCKAQEEAVILYD